MRKKKIIAMVSSTIVVLLLATGLFLRKSNLKVDTDLQKNLVAVEVENISKSEIAKHKKFSGVVTAGEKEKVSSAALANIKTINVKVGDYVKEGQIIMTLDSSKIDQQINSLNEANEKISEGVENSKAQLVEINLKKEDILGKKADLELEITTLEELNFSCDEELAILEDDLQNNIITKEEFITKKEQIAKYKSDNIIKIKKNKSEVKALNLSEIAIDETISGLEKLLNSNENAQSDKLGDVLEVLKDKKGDFIVKSNISGYIREINFKEGAMPVNLMKPGILIENDSTLDLQVLVALEDKKRFAVGDKIAMFIDNNGMEEEKVAIVESISEKPDDKTNQHSVVFTFDNFDKSVKIGEFAKVYVNTESKNDVVTVAKDAIIRENDKQFVYLCKNGKAIKTQVEVGIENHIEVEVLSGIKEKDKVIVNGKEFIEDKQEVNIVNEENDNENS